MSLTDGIITLMKTCDAKMNDRYQRSALGMADSYVRGVQHDYKEVKVDENNIPQDRDSLAAVIIGLIADHPKAEQKKALQAARKELDRPFANDPEILEWRRARHAKYPKGLGMAEG